MGTCFFVDDRVTLGSWRADCPGVDYSYSDGKDKGNSFLHVAGIQEDDNMEGLLGTATGVVTVQPSSMAATKSKTPMTTVPTTVQIAPTQAAAGTTASGSSVAAETQSGAASSSATGTPNAAPNAAAWNGLWLASFAGILGTAIMS